MTITATLIEDTISPDGIRLTTMQLRYPRFIHAEELTHRILSSQAEYIIYEAIPDGLMYDQDLSRNASSSRAIPVERMIADLRRDPAMPIYYGSNKPGMQAGAELTGQDLDDVKMAWLIAMDMAISSAEVMVKKGLHKQIANRILEPWAHINVVVTATDWSNFFALRSHPDAQPEIKQLSDLMKEAMDNSVPRMLSQGEWHLPYVLGSDWVDIKQCAKKHRITRDEPQYEELINLARKVSTARCARVSFLTHDGRKTTVEEDIELHDKLVVSVPLHASPAEHQATPDRWSDTGQASYGGPASSEGKWQHPELHGNLRGWIQHRKLLADEFVPG